MTEGFALVAWPARYNDTGVMTFIVNQDGVVYEKDLGPATTTAAQAIKAYNPDASWRKVLHRMRGEILGRLADVAGAAAPDRLGFQEEAWAGRAGSEARRDAAPEPARRDASPSPPPAALAREAEAIADPEMRSAFLEAAARYLARGRARSTENDHA